MDETSNGLNMSSQSQKASYAPPLVPPILEKNLAQMQEQMEKMLEFQKLRQSNLDKLDEGLSTMKQEMDGANDVIQ